MPELTTRELARDPEQPAVSIWIETTSGRLTLKMSPSGLFMLRSTVDAAVHRLRLAGQLPTAKLNTTELLATPAMQEPEGAKV